MIIREYGCDNCRKRFGENKHLNIKRTEVFISYFREDIGEWKQANLKAKCQEYHFCDTNCLKEFLDKKIKEIETEPK